MAQERYEQILHTRRTSSIAWENLSTNDCKITDLDKKRIQQVVNMAVSAGRLTELAANAGTLPPDIKLSELTKTHASYPRNPTIANVLFLCSMIERWGKRTYIPYKYQS